MLKNKNILLGVTGGIAAYKALDIVSRLKKQGANVKVIMTDHATEFVQPLSFQTLSGNVVYVDMFEKLANMDVEHISLAKWADLILLAPASANTLAKMAYGLCDNMLTTVLLAKRSPVMVAPAMNTYMLKNPRTQENLKILEKDGVHILPTDAGHLACGDDGEGKLLAPERIVDFVDQFFTKKDLEGVDIVVTAGGTREPIDPVRYIGNRSSGKMGYAIAKAAQRRGAKVHLISANSSLEPPLGVDFISVQTTQDLLDAADKLFDDCQVYISPAAPSDFRPKTYQDQKIKRKGKDELSIELTQNPDVIGTLSKRKKGQIMVAFAAESQNLVEHASEKLARKNVDFIVANNIVKKDAGFSTDTNIVTIIDKEAATDYAKQSKEDLAEIILDKIVDLLP